MKIIITAVASGVAVVVFTFCPESVRTRAAEMTAPAEALVDEACQSVRVLIEWLSSLTPDLDPDRAA